MVSRELFGWSPPHIQPLTPVSEVWEPPESPSLYIAPGAETSASQQVEVEEEIEEPEEVEPSPAALTAPLSSFTCISLPARCPVSHVQGGCNNWFNFWHHLGTVVATWNHVPRVERNVALPGLIRTFKMMGNYALTFVAIGGVYIGVKQLAQNARMKRDLVNGAVGVQLFWVTKVAFCSKLFISVRP
ncbi:Outer envelope pore protein-3/mitochondrial [Arachis hypogaea]|nr:Outer envelope pore protein-3/mitochondrial [Arachis hypogaea]